MVVHPDTELIARALARDPASCQALVDRLTPAIQSRVNAALIRRGRGNRQEVLDLTQEIFRVLLDQDGKILRGFDPARGASLPGYVGLVAERRLVSLLRSGRKSGWAEDPTDPLDFDAPDEAAPDPEQQAISRELLAQILEALKVGLSAQGYEMFQLLYVEEREVEWVVRHTGLSRDAVYAWRSRLHRAVQKVAQKISSDPVETRRSKNDGVRS